MSGFLRRSGLRVLVCGLLVFLAACEPVPLTGRQQLRLHGSADMNALGAQAYSAILDDSDVVTGTADARMVERVGNRIMSAVDSYLRDQGQAQSLDGYDWEFTLIEDDEANAFCLPGGKVAIHTGILDITETEDGLAVVMGHEIAHAIANHGNERMSQDLLFGVAGTALALALAGEDEDTQDLVLTAFGVGGSLGILLPFSRLHESEADKLGLLFMAMAGYDPREAPGFWRRMAESDGQEGSLDLEFLSTHPSHGTRIADLEQAIDEAMTYYQPDGDGAHRRGRLGMGEFKTDSTDTETVYRREKKTVNVLRRRKAPSGAWGDDEEAVPVRDKKNRRSSW